MLPTVLVLASGRGERFKASGGSTHKLQALLGGQTVLARLAQAAGMGWDADSAHSAVYDAEKTADLFCHFVNTWQTLDAAFKAVEN